jgi:uncharacterized protein YndB with AHSA1/START domain
MKALNRIEKHVVLKASIERVWRAITDAEEFGRWFGISLEGRFVVGEEITGTFSKSFDEQAIMEHQRSLGVPVSGIRRFTGGGLIFCKVERIEPESYFSFRWIPYGIDVDVNPNDEPTTLVEFQLAPAPEGTLLTITESGFEKVPEHRKLRAFRMNEDGWSAQLENIKRYVEKV